MRLLNNIIIILIIVSNGAINVITKSNNYQEINFEYHEDGNKLDIENINIYLFFNQELLELPKTSNSVLIKDSLKKDSCKLKLQIIDKKFFCNDTINIIFDNININRYNFKWELKLFNDPKKYKDHITLDERIKKTPFLVLNLYDGNTVCSIFRSIK